MHLKPRKSLTPLVALALGEGMHLSSSLGTHSPVRCQGCHQRAEAPGASPECSVPLRALWVGPHCWG